MSHSNIVISEFLAALSKHGLQPYNPADIRADNKRRNYRLYDDPSNKKRGYYILAAEGDFGYGYYGDYRATEAHSWHFTGNERQYSDFQIKHWKRQLGVQKQKADSAYARLAIKRAGEANEKLKGLQIADPGHPYLEAKGVKPYGIYQDGSDLVIPMRCESGICGLQTIGPDGSKLFMAEARKQGTWFVIQGDDDVVCVAEGYATAASIHEATGYTVITAWDAYNVYASASFVKSAYPKAQIIFCADNDCFTKDRDGRPSNTGIIQATKAAIKIGGYLAHPVFPPDALHKLTDYNDLHALSGLGAVRESIQAAVLPMPDEAAAEGVERSHDLELLSTPDSQALRGSNDWMNDLAFAQGGGLASNSINNAELFLLHDPTFAGIFKFNTFKSEIFIGRETPWDHPDQIAPRRMANTDLNGCEAFFERYAGMRINGQKLYGAIEKCAVRFPYHPVKEYFDSLEWDGAPRLDAWIKTYLCAEDQPDHYLSEIGKKWMVAAVKRIYEPGCKFDHMLVLEGPQNAGKSYSLRILGTIPNDNEEIKEEVYYTDAVTISSIEERGSVLKLQGKFIIEFPELAGLNKKDRDELKRWITLQTDEVEVKYQQFSRIMPRQFVLAGTYNPIPGVGWLNDPTGARRFWPVKTGKKIKLEELLKDRVQLWAEAVHVYKKGYQVHIDASHKINDALREEHAGREEEDTWEDEIERIVADREEWRTSEILEKMGIITARQTRKDTMRVANVMNRLAWSNKNIKRSGKVLKHWCAPAGHPVYLKSGANVLPLTQPRPAQPIAMEDEEEIKW